MLNPINKVVNSTLGIIFGEKPADLAQLLVLNPAIGPNHRAEQGQDMPRQLVALPGLAPRPLENIRQGSQGMMHRLAEKSGRVVKFLRYLA